MKKSNKKTLFSVLLVPFLTGILGLSAVFALILLRYEKADITFCLILTGCTVCYVLILSFYLYRTYSTRTARKNQNGNLPKS